MAVHYYVDEENDLLIGEASGLAVVDDFITSANKLFTETDGGAFYKNHLFVIEPDTLASLLSMDALVRLREQFEFWGEKYPGRDVRTVLLCEGTVEPLVFKRWQELSKEARNYRSDIRIMSDRAEAMAWLKEKKPVQPHVTRAR